MGEVGGALIALALAGIGLAVTWGALTTRIKVLESKMRDAEKQLKDSRVMQGSRIGKLERWRSFLEGASARRRPSRAVPVMADEEEREESGPANDE